MGVKHTLFGVPLDLSVSAPRDRVVIHPDIAVHFEAAAFRTHVTIASEVSTESRTPPTNGETKEAPRE